MLEWSAEQATELTTEPIDLEFLPTSTNVERGGRNLEFVLQRMHTALMALTGYEASDIVADSRSIPLEGLRTFLLEDALCWNSKQGSNDGNRYVSRHEKKLKDIFDDDIKLAGLVVPVPEELERHLILNSHRLRTFEDTHLEIVTYVEAMLGLRIRDSKPSDTASRGHSDPMDVTRSILLQPAKEEGHRVHEMVV